MSGDGQMSMTQRWEADEELWDQLAEQGKPVHADPSKPRWIEGGLEEAYGPDAPRMTEPQLDQSPAGEAEPPTA